MVCLIRWNNPFTPQDSSWQVPDNFFEVSRQNVQDSKLGRPFTCQTQVWDYCRTSNSTKLFNFIGKLHLFIKNLQLFAQLTFKKIQIFLSTKNSPPNLKSRRFFSVRLGRVYTTVSRLLFFPLPKITNRFSTFLRT